MKTHGFILALIWLGFGISDSLTSTANAATATSFEVSWWTVDGGGGVSSGGGFEVTGAIGQPDATARLAAGCWSIEPGFWGAYASINNAGSPPLQLQLINPTILRVRFNPGCDDWVLQYAVNLAVPPEFTTWADDEPGNLTPDGEELTRDFHLPSWGPQLFFRLRKP